MKFTTKLYSGVFLSLALVLCPMARAQESSAGTDVSQKISTLEDQIQSLQKEVEALKKQTASAPAPASPPAAAAPAASAAPSAFDSVSITGLVDGYYGFNFQHPHSAVASVPAGSSGDELTGFSAFTAPTNALTLNMAELTIAKAPDTTSRLGFDLGMGYGNAINVVNSTEPGGLGFDQYVKEAYLSYLAPIGKGLQLDFGKFVTPAGAEVIESNGNWNYSRGILFTYAIPFYHFGLRAKYAFNDKVSLTGFLMNGWNSVVDNNTGKTGGFSLGLTPNKKWGITENYLVGAEQPNDNSDVRHLSDTVVTFNPTGKLSLMANFDYGHDHLPGATGGVWWSGVAGYLRYAFTDQYAFAGRYEFYDDHDGFTTGAAQDLNEFTLTFERTFAKHLISRLEFRRDMSNQPSMLRGSTPTTDQNTVLAGLMYAFDIHEGH
jgi:Putative beta-barrel porin-2, OmpL-like. bbp2